MAAPTPGPSYDYILPAELAVLLLKDEQASSSKPVVVDVREDDFAGGHIRGAVNMPIDRFNDDAAVDALIDEVLKDNPRVVLHCALSKVRGPKAAGRLAARLQERGLTTPQVSVLRGGFTQWAEIYHADPALVEGQK